MPAPWDASELPDRLTEGARKTLKEKAAEPVPSHGQGRVRSTMLTSEVRPLVIDANVLRSEILRVTRRGGEPTRLITAASVGAVRLYCAQHVIDEVERHLTEWAEAASADPLEAARAWDATHRRLLVCVEDDPATIYLGNEAWRLDVLATSERRHLGDRDDLPTARLALALEAPLLSRDTALLRAVYGHDHDTAAHRDWVEQFGAMGEFHVLAQMQRSSAIGTELLVIGAFSLVRRYPWVALAAGVGAFLGTTSDQRRALGGQTLHAVKRVAEFVGALNAVVTAANELADTLKPPATDDEAARTPARRLSATMARLPEGTPSLPSLRALGTIDDATLDHVLGGSRLFVDLRDGTFQVGRPLGPVRRPA